MASSNEHGLRRATSLHHPGKVTVLGRQIAVDQDGLLDDRGARALKRSYMVIAVVALMAAVAPAQTLANSPKLTGTARVGRAEPNAFLNKSVKNHTELMRQIQQDEAVMDRYERHFGMSRDEVVKMMSGLTLGETSEDSVFLVYNVPESGELRARSIFYRRGTKIWVDRSGAPVLKASCGNPLVRGTDKVDQPVLADMDPGDENVRDLTNVEKPGEAVPSDLMAMDAPVDLEAAPAELEALLMPDAPATVPFVVPHAGAIPFSPGSLIPTLGILLGLPHGSDRTNPVPEPCSMIALGGLALVAARRRRRA